MERTTLVTVYLISINLITLAVFGIDKRRARRGKYRIRENTLLFLALIGGSLGAELGMYGFHHKTRHPRFFIGIPLILLLQILILFYFRTRL